MKVMRLFFLSLFAMALLRVETPAGEEIRYYANETFLPLDPDLMDEKTFDKLNSYDFVVLRFDANGSVDGYYEIYPYSAKHTRLKLVGKYDPGSKEVEVVADGWLYRSYFLGEGVLYVEEQNASERIEEVSKEEFEHRYRRALEKLSHYEPAQRMRRLRLGFEVSEEPDMGRMAIYPVGFKKVSDIDASAGVLWFLDTLLEAGGWKKREATPEAVMKRFPAFAPEDFNNTGRLDNFLDGLILLDNYLVRVGLSPFNGEHMESIEAEILGTASQPTP